MPKILSTKVLAGIRQRSAITLNDLDIPKLHHAVTDRAVLLDAYDELSRAAEANDGLIEALTTLHLHSGSFDVYRDDIGQTIKAIVEAALTKARGSNA